MQEVSGFPYFEIQFTKDGAINDERQATALRDFVAQGRVSDLLVISHGWNNDMNEARALYNQFLARAREQLAAGGTPGLSTRSFAVLGVLWPSKKFAEKQLIPSGAASLESPISDAALQEQLDDLKGVFDDPAADAKLDEAKQLVPRLQNSAAARKQFADLLRSLVPRSSADNSEDASESFFALPGDEVMRRLSRPVRKGRQRARPGSGGATALSGERSSDGGAAGFPQFFTGIKSAALNLMNFTTYYQMKERAGVVGSSGLNPVLRRLREQRPDLKLHLIGHSFGGRLVTAAAAGSDGQPAVKINSLTLLQAAFSHYGFANNYDGDKDGFFRRVVMDHRVSGPILITHTQNDRAVGLAYPLASLIAGQVASALGDKNDPYGGIGRNGAQKTPEAIEGSLLGIGKGYQLQAGKLYNLNSDAFISDHSDITGGEVVQAVLAAVATT